MTSKGSTPTSGLPAELQGLLAAERDPPRIAEPERAALIARLVAASEKSTDRATPWWSGLRLKPWSVAFGVAVFGGGVVWASQSGHLWPSEPSSETPKAPPEAARKTPNLSAVTGPSAAPATSAAEAVSDAPASSALALPTPPGAKRAALDSGDELSALETARAAQQRGDHAEALRSIAAHERRFPRSIFVEEREALRVSALGKLGRTTEARARARAFAARYPRSVFVSKLSPWLSD